MKILSLLAGLLGLGSVVGAAEPTVIWQLDQTVRLGGHALTVFGAPRVAKETGGQALYFNGASDGLLVPANPLEKCAAFTIEVLIKPEADGPEAQRFLHVQDEIGQPGDRGSRALLEIRLAGGTWALDGFLFSALANSKLTLLDPAKRHPAGQWTWVALTYEHGHMITYVNGAQELAGEVAFAPLGAGQVSLGVRQNKVYWFKGGMREVRWHAAALKPEELQR